MNATELQLLSEEKNYESQIRKQKEVHEEMIKNYTQTIQKFESKRSKFEFVNDHYKHVFK